MTVTHRFHKSPSSKNGANRSLSFTVDQTKLIQDNDAVEITVKIIDPSHSARTHEVFISMNGGDFIRKLEDKKTKGGEDFQVFKF